MKTQRVKTQRVQTQRVQTPLLVTAEWLEKNLNSGDLRIVDCRWVLGKPGEGRRQFEEAHIPGAVHLDVDRDLSGKVGPGRHPIPTQEEFALTMDSIGVTPETYVIAYDAGNGMPAPRLWWLLRYFGHERVSVLDGGWKGWRATVDKASSASLSASHLRPSQQSLARRDQGFQGVVNKAYVQSHLNDPAVLLLDARAPERYRGEIEPIDKRPGHIPGAVNVPYSGLVDENGRYCLPPLLLSDRSDISDQSDKAKDVICYCGSGITACTDIFALKLAGIDAKLYEGSWSEWSSDNNLPIEAGKK